MGKQELINQVSRDREKWPAEARVCEKLWILTQKLRNSNLMQDYIDGKYTEEEIDLFLHEQDNSNMIQDILDLKQECSKMLPDIKIEKNVDDKITYFKVLSDLGMILADECLWWERYETITRTMGVECVLSIRTAESLFKRDPKAPKIKDCLEQLAKEDI